MIKNGYIKVSVNAPSALLEFSDFSTGCYVCYAQTALRDKNYFDYFLDKAKKTDHEVILRQHPKHKLMKHDVFIELGHTIGANMIVPPIAEDDPDRSLELHFEFMEFWNRNRDRNRSLKILCCPRGVSIGKWRKQFKEMEDTVIHGIAIDGSDATKPGEDPDLVRRKIIQSLSAPAHKTKEFYIHLLGTFTNLAEYNDPAYRDVDSIDSDAPVMAGLYSERAWSGKFPHLLPSFNFSNNFSKTEEGNIIFGDCEDDEFELWRLESAVYNNIAWFLRGCHARLGRQEEDGQI